MKKNKIRYDGKGAVLAALIPLIGFAIFTLLPLLLSTIISFTELHTTDVSEMEWIGFDNYISVITDRSGRYYPAWLTTLLFTLNVPFSIFGGLYLARILDKTRHMKRLFRSLFFVPYVCSIAVVTLTFKILFGNENGVVNTILDSLGFERIEWLTNSPYTFIGVVIVLTVWRGLGYSIVLYQAALANVNDSYYEAAQIDGATSFQIFWKITWPAISPTTGFLVTTKVIAALQALAETYVLIQGQNGIIPMWNDTAIVSDTVTRVIYNAIFVRPYAEGFGYGAAAGWVLAITIFIITRINLKLQRKWVCYDF